MEDTSREFNHLAYKEQDVQPRNTICSSYFYCPALRLSKLLDKVGEVDPEAVVIDIEDSIHPSQKDAARAAVMSYDFGPLRAMNKPIGLRLNTVRSYHGLRDLLFLEDLTGRGPCFDFVLLPKIRDGGEVEIYRAHFDRMAVPLMAYSFIETIDAVTHVDSIASLSDALCFGQADLSAELYAPNAHFLAEAVAKLTAAAAKHRVPAIDTNSFEIQDMSVVEAQSRASLEAGFTGKAAIHPLHVPVINNVFRTAPNVFEDYRSTISDYDTQGCGFKIYGDRVVAPPFVAKAQLMLKLHDTEPAPLPLHARRSGPRS